ncbi:hypothetical protein KM043_013169 [Ampulex compressa]|nr:hypothetical protein KM043_013169 [Ampulex compressa]
MHRFVQKAETRSRIKEERKVSDRVLHAEPRIKGTREGPREDASRSRKKWKRGAKSKGVEKVLGKVYQFDPKAKAVKTNEADDPRRVAPICA